MPSVHDPDGNRLPIKLDSTSNGEFVPVPLDPVNRHAVAVQGARQPLEKAGRGALVGGWGHFRFASP